MSKIINLISPEQKEEVEQEKKLKTLFCLAVFPFLFIVIFCGALYFIKYFGTNFITQDKFFYLYQIEELADISEKENDIKKFNNLITEIDSFYKNQKEVTSLLEEIKEIIPESAYYKTIQLEKRGADLEFVLSGTAIDWETVFEIEETFKEMEKFGNLNFSPQNWTKEKDIDFLVSFVIKNE